MRIEVDHPDLEAVVRRVHFHRHHRHVHALGDGLGRGQGVSRETYIIQSESEPVDIESGDQIDIVPSFIQRKRGTRQTWQCIVQEWS